MKKESRANVEIKRKKEREREDINMAVCVHGFERLFGYAAQLISVPALFESVY